MDNSRLAELEALHVCRACLTDEGDMRSVFNCDVEEQQPLWRKIEIISSVEVNESDGLPGLICNNCERRLNTAFEFREQCQKSYSKLKKYIESTVIIKNEISIELEEELVASEFQTEKPVTAEHVEAVLEMEEQECDGMDRDSTGSDEDLDDKPLLHRQEKNGASKCLEQFTAEDVNRAIVQSKRRYNETRECRLCGFLSSNARGLSLHISHLHKELKERWCGICYQEVEQLGEHLQEHARTKAHVCTFCGKGFSSQGHLTEHMRGHSAERPHKCDSCPKAFLSARHLRVHQRIHSGERPYVCPHCGRSFTQNGSLQGHIRTHTGLKPFRCGTCGKTCTTSSALASHRLKSGHVREPKPVQEQETEPSEGAEESKVQAQPEVHKTEAMDEELVQVQARPRQSVASKRTQSKKLCTVCGKTFSTASKLRLHMRVHTGETPYKCSHCDKRFSTRGQLVVHVRTHTGERPHVCQVCGKRFAQSSVLGTHMRLHTGRPEQCSVCGRRFCRPAELRLHMRRHTGEKPYLCTHCGQTFVQRSHLMEHVKIHSDERPYKCTVCGRAFKQSSSLKSHVQIHTGNKPYKCSQCPYACRQSYALTQHMRQHQVDQPRADRPHECPVCHRAFTTQAMLSSHARTVHQALF